MPSPSDPHPGDPDPDLLVRVDEVVRAVVTAFGELPDEEWAGRLRAFPVDGCEHSSWILGSLLAELGLGDWTMVGRSDGADTERHVWLELRDADGGVRLTVDVSLHQFEGFSEPQSGRGPLAAHERWPRPQWESRIDRREPRYGHPVYAVPLAWTRERLLAGSRRSSAASR